MERRWKCDIKLVDWLIDNRQVESGVPSVTFRKSSWMSRWSLAFRTGEKQSWTQCKERTWRPPFRCLISSWMPLSLWSQTLTLLQCSSQGRKEEKKHVFVTSSREKDPHFWKNPKTRSLTRNLTLVTQGAEEGWENGNVRSDNVRWSESQGMKQGWVNL